MKLPIYNKNDTYKEQTKATIIELICELPNFVVMLVQCFLLKTSLVFADTLYSFSIIVHFLIVIVMTVKLTKDNGDKYNKGVGRLETFISLVCEVLVAVGFAILIGLSVSEFKNPQPVSSMFWFYALVKLSNTTFDVCFLIKQIKIRKQSNSRINETEYNTILSNVCFDILSGLVVVVCFFFRTFVWTSYLSPIGTILLSLYLLFLCFKRARDSVFELVNRSIDIKRQDEIYDIVLSHSTNLKKIKDVNCIVVNKKIEVEVILEFEDDTKYIEQINILNEIKRDVSAKIPDSHVVLVLDSNEKEEINEGSSTC